jgi:tRNA-(ms[2]io[6]A)-hydroxylase
VKSSLLLCKTHPCWLERAVSELDSVLLDHAHCEKKAAGMMLGLLFRWPDSEANGQLSRMIREELVHFEMVLRELKRRNQPFSRQIPSSYAEELSKGARKKVFEESMLDAFVLSALIEARSHERMQLLAEAAPEPELKTLFRTLEPAEDRHWQLMLELAGHFGDPAPRLALFAAQEAEVITRGAAKLQAAYQPGSIRMHS